MREWRVAQDGTIACSFDGTNWYAPGADDIVQHLRRAERTEVTTGEVKTVLELVERYRSAFARLCEIMHIPANDTTWEGMEGALRVVVRNRDEALELLTDLRTYVSSSITHEDYYPRCAEVDGLLRHAKSGGE
jgi:hypothetical protein